MLGNSPCPTFTYFGLKQKRSLHTCVCKRCPMALLGTSLPISLNMPSSIHTGQNPLGVLPTLHPPSPLTSFRMPLLPHLWPPFPTFISTGLIYCSGPLLSLPPSFPPSLLKPKMPFRRWYAISPFPGAPLQKLDTGQHLHRRQWPQDAELRREELSLLSE